MSKKISTKELLVNSALELIQTMTFDEMTVQTIVDNCGIARKTFYNHFEDKFALFRFIYEKSVMDFFRNINAEYTWQQALTDSLTVLERYFPPAQSLENKELVDVFPRKLMEAILELFQKYDVPVDRELSYLVKYTSYAHFNAVNRWHKGGHEQSPSELAALLVSCLPQQIAEALKSKSILK